MPLIPGPIKYSMLKINGKDIPLASGAIELVEVPEEGVGDADLQILTAWPGNNKVLSWNIQLTPREFAIWSYLMAWYHFADRWPEYSHQWHPLNMQVWVWLLHGPYIIGHEG